MNLNNHLKIEVVIYSLVGNYLLILILERKILWYIYVMKYYADILTVAEINCRHGNVFFGILPKWGK